MRTTLFILFLTLFSCSKNIQNEPTPPIAKTESSVIETLDATLNATMWMRHAAEYAAICQQTFEVSKHLLEARLEEKTSAFDEKPSQNLPPAIIFDLDETLLDNSEYQNMLFASESTYKKASWNEWVNRIETPAMPGAKEFLEFAKSKGVALFYVSNRYPETFESTKENLIKLGFPLEGDAFLLLRGSERDKQARRLKVAQDYRIVMMFGDSLGDFHSAFDSQNIEERTAQLKKSQAHFGFDWIVLPNPVYGTWLGAIESLPAEPGESLRDKKVRYLRQPPAYQ